MSKNQDLKLVYVLKIGYNSSKEGLYEFIFSKDPSSINIEELGWDQIPAASNAESPEVYDKKLELTTKKLDLKCLHESNDRSYMDGYYTIHCLAHENLESDNSDLLHDEMPLLVFHYNMKLKEVKDMLYSRDIIFKEVEGKKQAVAVESDLDDDDEDEDDN